MDDFSNPMNPSVQIPEALMPSVQQPSQQLSVPVGPVNVPLMPQAQVPQQASAPQQAQPVSAQYAKPEVVQPAVAVQPAMPQEAQTLIDSYNPQIKAQKAIVQAASDSAQLKETALAEQELQVNKQMERQQALQNQFNDDYKAKASYLDDVSKKLASDDFANPKIESNRVWTNMSTGSKILAGIAMALGGYGGALSGKGDNKALDVINKAIDRDIEEQKFNLQQKSQNMRDQVSVGQSMLGNLRAKFGDDVQAETALRLISNQQVQNKLAKIAAGTESKVVQANLANVVAPLQREQAQLGMQLKAQIAEQARKARAFSGQPMSAMDEAELPKEYREALISQRERSVPGFTGQAKDKESASKFQDLVEKSTNALNAVKQLEAFTTEGMNWTPEKRAEAATQLELVVGSLREPILGPGTMQEKEYGRLVKAIGNPDALLSYGAAQRARLQIIKKNLESNLDTKAETFGFRPQPKVSNTKLRPY